MIRRRYLALAMLSVVAFVAGGCSNDGSADDQPPANCGHPSHVYSSLNAQLELASYDSTTDEVLSVWRDAEQLVYVVTATKSRACLVHVGRQMSGLPL